MIGLILLLGAISLWVCVACITAMAIAKAFVDVERLHAENTRDRIAAATPTTTIDRALEMSTLDVEKKLLGYDAWAAAAPVKRRAKGKSS